MNHIIFIFVIFLTTLFGFLMSLILTEEGNRAEKIGLGMLIGPLSITYIHFIANYYFGIPINLLSLLSLLIILSIFIYITLYVVKGKSRIKSLLKYKIPKLSKSEIILLIFLMVVIIFSFIQDFIWPIYEWDALTLYDFRAKIIASNFTFAPLVQTGYFFGYPPFTSLLHSYGYLLNIEYVKIWYSYLFIGLLVAMYGFLRKETSRQMALFGTILLAISPHIVNHSLIAYTNLPYAMFLSMGILYITSWVKHGSMKDLLIGSILVSGSTWIRLTEPFWIIAVLLIIFGLFKHKKHLFYAIFGVLVILFTRQPWLHFKNEALKTSSTGSLSLIANHSSNIFSHALLYIHNFPQAILFLNKALSPTLGAYLPIIAVSLIIGIKFRNFSLTLLNFVWIVSLLMILYGTLVLSVGTDYWSKIPGSVTRMSIFLIIIFIPIIVNTITLIRQKYY